mmetsp:Transcript_7609/g.16491  ORF Transcript_7609/g.16491 Transcript_7609/m.16491 type:complete len:1013 (+) Transcript_7609:148-3186(+)|eukprot:CAMPEP_0202897138 /NCGR_PEP_ID=MMETSP1392-20130828/5981_1 /ASSEMBLY_ACC=CAM_ASM_000868 /TAXON_ID=225041 /ORGANISM="Chlamydomonas chlamydogama, Strain SAG 11-48b" /LENGTH=1012 /DNA_ID=CAMNT_0049582707 /DNA_START=122 /DNA_END=3160 /DNA_ORIENTATION=+
MQAGMLYSRTSVPNRPTKTPGLKVHGRPTAQLCWRIPTKGTTLTATASGSVKCIPEVAAHAVSELDIAAAPDNSENNAVTATTVENLEDSTFVKTGEEVSNVSSDNGSQGADAVVPPLLDKFKSALLSKVNNATSFQELSNLVALFEPWLEEEGGAGTAFDNLLSNTCRLHLRSTIQLNSAWTAGSLPAPLLACLQTHLPAALPALPPKRATSLLLMLHGQRILPKLEPHVTQALAKRVQTKDFSEYIDLLDGPLQMQLKEAVSALTSGEHGHGPSSNGAEEAGGEVHVVQEAFRQVKEAILEVKEVMLQVQAAPSTSGSSPPCSPYSSTSPAAADLFSASSSATASPNGELASSSAAAAPMVVPIPALSPNQLYLAQQLLDLRTHIAQDAASFEELVRVLPELGPALSSGQRQRNPAMRDLVQGIIRIGQMRPPGTRPTNSGSGSSSGNGSEVGISTEPIPSPLLACLREHLPAVVPSLRWMQAAQLVRVLHERGALDEIGPQARGVLRRRLERGDPQSSLRGIANNRLRRRISKALIVAGCDVSPELPRRQSRRQQDREEDGASFDSQRARNWRSTASMAQLLETSSGGRSRGGRRDGPSPISGMPRATEIVQGERTAQQDRESMYGRGMSGAGDFPPNSNLLAVSAQLPADMSRSVWAMSDYSDLEELYNGYASTVFRGICKRSGMPVALKVYRPDALHEISRHQMLREVRLHSQLDHPNIIKLYGAFRQEGHVVLVQEYACGGDLMQLIMRNGARLTESEAVRMVVQPLLRAMHYLHSRSIVHRDLKLENILFSGETMTLKVADFGLCLNIREERSVTRAGTLDYMAPEVLRCPRKSLPGHNKDREDLAYGYSADVWALGVLSYELINGCSPFTRREKAETERLIMSAEPPPFVVDVSEEARSFIYRCLIRDPMSRPSAWQLMGDSWVKVVPRCTGLGTMSEPPPDGPIPLGTVFDESNPNGGEAEEGQQAGNGAPAPGQQAQGANGVPVAAGPPAAAAGAPADAAKA